MGFHSIRWITALAILIFGLFTIDTTSMKWALLGLLLFSSSLSLQLSSSISIQIWSLWWGIFLVLQSILSPLILDTDYHTLPPGMRAILDIKAGIPGINGEQIITTDDKGYRTTKNIDYKSNESYRIFTIGASTTEQILLDDHRTWTHLLQENLANHISSNVETINTGVSGLRAVNNLASLQHISSLHPDMVIFLLGINDWNWDIANTRNNAIENARKRAHNSMTLPRTLLGKTLIAALSAARTKKVINTENHGEYFSNLRGSLKRQEKYAFRPEDVHSQYKETLSAISKICHEQNLECIFLTQPSGYQKNATEEFTDGFWMTPPEESYTLSLDDLIRLAALYNAYLIDFAKTNDHMVCDIAAELAPLFDIFYDDCHFNIQGSQKVAKLVTECIIDKYPQQDGILNANTRQQDKE